MYLSWLGHNKIAIGLCSYQFSSTILRDGRCFGIPHSRAELGPQRHRSGREYAENGCRSHQPSAMIQLLAKNQRSYQFS